MEPIEIGKHLIIHPNVCHGKLTFKGTRVPVQTVLVFMVLEGDTYEEILESWPYLKREAIEEAIRFAAVAWPELLRPEAEEALKRLAEPWRKGRKKRRKPIAIGRHLVIDPGICFGKLTFQATRLPVQTVLGYMALKGRTVKRIQRSWPHVKREAIEEAIRIAAVAWPELMQDEAAEGLRRLAADLVQQDTPPAEATDEPARSGRTG